jgi:hypothetical protein
MLEIFSFLLKARSTSIVTAPLATEAVFAVTFFRTGLIWHMNFAEHTGYSNKRHFYSEQSMGTN